MNRHTLSTEVRERARLLGAALLTREIRRKDGEERARRAGPPWPPWTEPGGQVRGSGHPCPGGTPSRPERACASRPERACASRPERACASRPEHTCVSRPERACASRPERACASRPEQACASRPEHACVLVPVLFAHRPPPRVLLEPAPLAPSRGATGGPPDGLAPPRPPFGHGHGLRAATLGSLLALVACSPPPPPPASTPPPVPSASAPALSASADLPSPTLPEPPSSGPLLIEAESLVPEGPGWAPHPWGDNLFASTFANTFLSRRAFLGASADARPGAVARTTVRIPRPGRYLALVRYEQPYRFDGRFRLRISQGGAARLDRAYGMPGSSRIWPFSMGARPAPPEGWLGTENIVWEGHESAVQLAAGEATVELITEASPSTPGTPPGGPRNVDAILLTTDEADVKARITRESYLPLDGLLTQTGDLYLQASVDADGAPVKLTLPPGTEHSPYWVHQRTWKSLDLSLKPGERSDWIEVGHLLDTLNDGQWKLQATPTPASGPIRVHLTFAVPTASGSRVIATFDLQKPQTELWFSAATRTTHHLREADAALHDLVTALRASPAPGRPPQRTLVYAQTFDPRPKDPPYEAARAEFIRLMGLTAPAENLTWYLPKTPGPRRGYLDLRERSPQDLEKVCARLTGEKLADQVSVVSLGDEIQPPAPGAGDNEAFRTFVKQEKLRPAELDPASGGDVRKLRYAPPADPRRNPAMHYHAGRFRHQHGLTVLKRQTDVLRRCLPNALFGANYSPHHGTAYLGETFSWIDAFRQDILTLPWTEDYTWQLPIASPQVYGLSLDTLQAGIRFAPRARLLTYVMAHSPGATPRSWRRHFYGDIAHGASIFNLFEFRPLVAAYTENYTEGTELYTAIRAALHELGTFEDLVLDARLPPLTARPAADAVALWTSEAADLWNDHSPPFGADRRSLYLALRHLHLPVAVVTEDDDERDHGLRRYRALLVTERHVTRAAVRRLQRWVDEGGTLLVTAGAMQRDELDAPNPEAARLLGVDEASLEQDGSILYEKQDLPFARSLATLSLGGSSLAIPGARARLTPRDAEVLATFADGSPAHLRRKQGQGQVISLAYLAGLAYVQPALPLRPVDRAPRDDAHAHFLPTAFAAPLRAELARLLGSLTPLVSTSHPLVETSLVEAPKGWLLPLIDWSGAASTEVTVSLPAGPFRKATLASGAPVTLVDRGGRMEATVKVTTADALVLR